MVTIRQFKLFQPLVLIVFATFALLSLNLQAQTSPTQPLTAYVDRTEISLGQAFTLTIRVDANLGNNRPSLVGLNQNFDQVGGISTRSTYTNNNGNIQSWTEYSIVLRPRDTGTFEIPSLRVGGEFSAPITITVSESDLPASGDTDEIFLSTTVNKETLYVQEQLIYTIRIYYSIGFDQGAQLSTPQVENAVVQQLGSDENFQEVVGGIGYNVTERRFVVYPQSSGELNIPSVFFTASIGRRGGANRFFNTRNTVREINLQSEAHTLTVKARPANFPGQTWLPASELSLKETWSDELDTVSVGDAITRNIELVASGLSSSLLPGIEYDDLAGLRFYPDQPVREDSANRNGIIGMRSEGTAIVASRPGEFELPEVRLPWWNTTTDSLQTAVLPARTIKVIPAVNLDGEQTEDTQSGAIPTMPIGNSNSTAATTTSSTTNKIWIASSVFFGLAWVLTLFFWMNSRRQLAYVTTVGGTGQQSKPIATKDKGGSSVQQSAPEANAMMRILKTACDSNKLPDIRKALLKWGQASFSDPSIQTLSQLGEQCRHKKLSDMLSDLDAALYGDSNQTPDSKSIYNEIAKLHKNGVSSSNKQGKYSLPPLYKN